eukprot:CAMPEP_0114680612 /NCGR_PEP_ID=MMETSP0191-20121206/54365_1 /TAXON_ID=126664 /ORGANISM="Sorites sp." /LENGTH=33 /DNA_ID= /DNA_START= /DNA_END= /DNA_ORIENTATION=
MDIRILGEIQMFQVLEILQSPDVSSDGQIVVEV